MTRTNAEDGPEEDAVVMTGGTVMEETASTFSFLSTPPKDTGIRAPPPPTP
jgi:hypothetical protein